MRHVRRRRQGAQVTDLTAREIQILERVSLGWTNEVIAAEFSLSLDTVKTYVRHIGRKLGMPHRAGMVRAGFERGYLTVRGPNDVRS